MLALHTQGSVIYPGPAESAPAGSAALAAAMSEASGYPVEPVPEASANAGFKDWFLQCFRRPAFTIEMGIGENPLPMTQLPRALQGAPRHHDYGAFVVISPVLPSSSC